MDALLTTQQVADHFNVHPETVKEWVRKRKLRAVRTPGGQYRYRAEDVRAAIVEASGEPSEPAAEVVAQ
jgi:excisionase family DNA binding protein